MSKVRAADQHIARLHIHISVSDAQCPPAVAANHNFCGAAARACQEQAQKQLPPAARWASHPHSGAGPRTSTSEVPDKQRELCGWRPQSVTDRQGRLMYPKAYWLVMCTHSKPYKVEEDLSPSGRYLLALSQPGQRLKGRHGVGHPHLRVVEGQQQALGEDPQEAHMLCLCM